jgi:hypothetical protein
LVNILIWFALFILPVLIIIVIPLYLIIRGLISWRKRRQRNRKTQAEAAPEEASQEE